MSCPQGHNHECVCRCGPSHTTALMPTAQPPWAGTYQEDHIQALQLSPQGFLAEEIVHPELLGLAAGQLAFQPPDPQEAPACRREGDEVQVSILVDGCRAVVLGVSRLLDLTLSNGGRSQGGEVVQQPTRCWSQEKASLMQAWRGAQPCTTGESSTGTPEGREMGPLHAGGRCHSNQRSPAQRRLSQIYLSGRSVSYIFLAG